jgi:transposase InsO family protein
MEIQTTDSEPQAPSTQSATSTFASYQEFHHAVGHFHIPNPERLYKDFNSVPKRPEGFHCDECQSAKSTHKKPKERVAHAIHPFENVHSDLSGKFSTQSMAGSRYFITFIDEATRYSWVRFLKNKSEAAQTILDFISFVKVQHKANIQRFTTDCGGEYMAKDLKAKLNTLGIVHRSTPPYSHESNGLAERFNRTIVTAARAMIAEDRFLFLWPEAIATAVFLKNIAPHSALSDTPYHRLMGTKPSVKHLHPFGQSTHVHIPVETRQPGTKLNHRTELGIFIGYGKSVKAHRVYIPDRHVILESQDTTFRPWVPPPSAPASSWELNTQTVSFDDNSLREDHQNIKQPRQMLTENQLTIPNAPTQSENSAQSSPTLRRTRSTRLPAPSPGTQTSSGSPSRRRTNSDTPSSPITLRSGRTVIPTRRAGNAQGNVTLDAQEMSYERPDVQAEIYAFGLTAFDIPQTYHDAEESAQWPQWQEAMNNELAAHKLAGTWEDTNDIPERAVGSRWVFNVKLDNSGNPTKYKARVVAQGFSQRPGHDYFDTYSPVVRYDTLRLLMCMACTLGWEIHQIDFDTAYLNGVLKEVIYMRPPPGYASKNKYLRLRKTLYGLKQSGREWWHTLSTELNELGFQQMKFDPCVFTSFQPHPLVIAVYVDDLLLLGYATRIHDFKSVIATKFKCKDLGTARYLLGIEINHHKDRITLGQPSYARKVLQRFEMENCNGRKTPLDPNSIPLRSSASPDEDPIDEQRRTNYQQLTGSSNYLVIGTRPDLAYTNVLLGTYNSNPSALHHRIAIQSLRYVQHSKDHLLTFRRPVPMPEVHEVKIFSDASWGSDPDNAKSFHGYILQVNGNTVSWSSRRQASVAKSTCEAEYMACSYAAAHLVWTRQALKEVFGSFLRFKFILATDNQAAIILAKDQRINARSKHIAIHYHFVRERYLNGEFEIEHVSSALNVADVCTKGLPLPLLQDMKTMMGLA